MRLDNFGQRRTTILFVIGRWLGPAKALGEDVEMGADLCRSEHLGAPTLLLGPGQASFLVEQLWFVV